MSTLTTEQFLDGIAEGKFDADLGALKQVVEDRIGIRKAYLTVKDFPVGSKVRFNDLVSPRYMIGQTATVVEHRVKKIVVVPDNPMGRFDRNGKAPKTVCDIQLVDLVS